MRTSNRTAAGVFQQGAHILVVLGLVLLHAGCDDEVSCPEGTREVPGGCVQIEEGSPVDGGTPDADAGTSQCVPEGDGDPIDPLGIDSNCDGADGVVAQTVYVAPPPLGNDAHPGTPSQPLATIGAALSLAGSTKVVVVAVGTYPAPVTTASSRVRVHGGYDPAEGWKRGSARSVIMPSAAGAVAFTAHALGEDSVLDQLEFRAPASTITGGSSVAVSLKGTGSLELVRSVVQSGNGAAGADGVDGAPGTPGEAGTAGDICARNAQGACVAPTTMVAPPTSACVLGATTLGGAGGTPGSAGGDSPLGIPGGHGSFNDPAGTIGGARAGSRGRVGRRGGNAAGGSGIGTFDAELRYVPTTAAAGTRGTNGEGGGGGGGGRTYTCFSPSTTVPAAWEAALAARGGSGGNGGCGGGPGSGGGGGGGSFGIVAAGIDLVLVDTTVVTGAGGRGGGAGIGAPGGLGSEGGSQSSGCVQVMTVPTKNLVLELAAPGGAGGGGGAGGHGGGGVGGPSIGVVLLDGATAALKGESAFALGRPGDGGNSAGNRGARGLRVAALP